MDETVAVRAEGEEMVRVDIVTKLVAINDSAASCFSDKNALAGDIIWAESLTRSVTYIIGQLQAVPKEIDKGAVTDKIRVLRDAARAQTENQSGKVVRVCEAIRDFITFFGLTRAMVPALAGVEIADGQER